MGISVSRVGDADLEDLVASAQDAATDDSPEMNEIVGRFDRLAMKIARSLSSCPYLQADLANEARVALVRAVRRHELGRPGFPNYARTFMRGAASRARERLVARPSVETATDPLEMPEPMPVMEESMRSATRLPWESESMASAMEAIAPEHRNLLVLRHVDDVPMKELAGASGTTVSAVSQRLATARRSLARHLSAA